MHRFRSPEKKNCGIALTICLSLLVATTEGAEVVKLKNGQTLRGTLLQYDERGLKISYNRRVLFYQLHELENVEANFGPFHLGADEAFARRDFAKAAEDYRRALDEEERSWAKARIQSNLVRALSSAGRLKESGEEFLKLAKQRDDPEVMVLAPLIWMPDQPVTPKTIDLARGWIDGWLNGDNSEMAGLLACSWLLETKDGERILPLLQQLGTFPEQRISWMARAQRWRARVGSVTKEEISEFRELIEKIPVAIRGGPQYLLGIAYQEASEPTDAALAFLWVPFVYADGSDLAADALLRAGRASEKAGFEDDAHKLYRELVEKYPGTRWAKEAQDQLE